MKTFLINQRLRQMNALMASPPAPPLPEGAGDVSMYFFKSLSLGSGI